jgi:hypothetical protein
MPKVNTECMNVYLQEMSDNVGKDEIILVMDQAGWHKTDKLKIPNNIEVVYLSPYSPELNPVERLWQHIKNNVVKNKVYDNIWDLEDSVCQFLNSIMPSTISSVCNVAYLSI